MTKTHAAFLFSARELAKNGKKLYLWTITLENVMAVKETRKFWNNFLTSLMRVYLELQGLRVFELHPGGHGLHVHLIVNERIDVNSVREVAEQAGWGRIHVQPMDVGHVNYLVKYLSKKRPECLKRWRLWQAFGKGWESRKVKDIEKKTLFSTIYRACKEWKGWEGKKGFFDRIDFTRRMLFLTIEKGWTPGLGPNDKPYWMCSGEELEFDSPDFDAPF